MREQVLGALGCEQRRLQFKLGNGNPAPRKSSRHPLLLTDPNLVPSYVVGTFVTPGWGLLLEEEDGCHRFESRTLLSAVVHGRWSTRICPFDDSCFRLGSGDIVLNSTWVIIQKSWPF